ncbi:TRAP transporter large permease subunit [Ideonella sp. A 288]|uniref:TRAP transporter large permease n=1 Tax=Ideonella sp. A 288 TaxID=1962181 RepID=UPI000B4AB085|nr:TRAP transporter large permease subunit [Ideonella sp. A 288]
MSQEILGLVALGVLFAVIFIGFPIAFTLGFVSLATGYYALGPVVFDLAVLQTYSVMKDTVLAAIPFFLFMGFLLEQSGIMERLFNGIQQLLARLNGSLYLAVLITATIFAAATGIVGSSVTLLGVMAGPSMIKSGYDPKMSAGAITAGGTLGILIPPSVMLIVMGPVVGVPATDLFAAAVIPGLMLSGLFIAWTLIRCWRDPSLGPALPEEMRPKSMGPVIRDLLIGVMPVIVVILSTLGVILIGAATPTDAGAIGCLGTFLLTWGSGRLTLPKLRRAAYATLEISSMILLLVTASNLFGAVFSRLGSADFLAQALTSLSLPPMLMLLVILALIFVLGWPLEWVPIVLIVMPIAVPIVTAAGIDLVWFCTLVAVTLQTAWLSPPVALSAYFLKGVVPQWELKDIYAGMVQFMVLQLVGVGLLLIFPKLATWLPSVN